MNRQAEADFEQVNLLIHIGYPKTASTWLQKSVFTQSEYGLATPWDNIRPLAISNFTLINPFKFNPHMARSVFLSGIKEANSQGKIAVISDETLGGDPLRGWINPKVIAERIHQTFPEARILICIREQKSTLHSLYSEYIKHGHTGKLQDFIGTTGEHLGKAPICDIAQLEYDRLIDHYHTLFGKEQVTVLTFENFLANKKAFLQQLLSAANPDITLPDFSISHKIENSSLGPATLNLRRIFNNISRSPDWSLPRQPFTFRLNQKASSILDRIIPEQYQAATKVTNKRVIDDFIGDRYRASNKRTIELTGLDLSALGYET